MPNEEKAKANRTLHIKFTMPSPDAAKLLASMMKNAAPLYKTFGDARIRLLRNADDQTRFLQVMEYQADRALEQSRQKLASDPVTHNFVQVWRSIFPGAMEVDVYEDVTDGVM